MSAEDPAAVLDLDLVDMVFLILKAVPLGWSMVNLQKI